MMNTSTVIGWQTQAIGAVSDVAVIVLQGALMIGGAIFATSEGWKWLKQATGETWGEYLVRTGTLDEDGF